LSHFILERVNVRAIVIFLSLLISSANIYAQRYSEIHLSNGEHAKYEKPKCGVSSVKIENGKVVSIRKENLDEVVGLIVTFKDLPLAAYRIKGSSLRKTSIASLYASLQASHASFRTALNTVKQQLSAQLKSDYSYAIKRDYYRSLNGVAIECKRGMIDKIRALPMVQNVSLDGKVKCDLAQSVRQIRADIVQDSLGYTGNGVVIGDIDTGIDYDNPALGGGFGPAFRVIGGYDFANNDSDPMDDHGHGTHVAGIIGAKSGDTLRGVAPDVRLLAIKVLDASGFGRKSNVIAGIDYCLDPDGNPATDDAVDIMNMSLGGEPSATDPLENAVDNATRAGVLCVIAAGNSGYNRYGTIGSPGTSESALTVGACDSTDRIAFFSSLGPDPVHSSIKPEVVAPGVDILSTILHNQTASWGGTSMAAPHVTGIAALLKQEHPLWTPEEIKGAIVNSAHSVGDNVSVFAQGKGCVDALDAARARMVVEPGVISYGYADLVPVVWKDTVQLTVKNFRSVPQNAEISVEGLPDGATLTFDKTSFSLAPGGETAVLVMLAVPSSVPVLSTEPFAYCGKIKVTSDSDDVVVPLSFIKSTTLVITFDLPPYVLWLVDRAGGTIKEAYLDEGATRYVVPVSQGYSLDLLASLQQDSLDVVNWYLVHQIIDNPTGRTYVLVTHDQAAINMADDTICDIHNSPVTLDSATSIEVSFQLTVYDERSGQHKNMSDFEYSWSFPPDEWRVFFPPLDSLFFIRKSITIPQDSNLFLLRKSVYGLQDRQDIVIAAGADNLCGYHMTGSYDDPCLSNPAQWSKNNIYGYGTWQALQGGWSEERYPMPISAITNNFYYNKPDRNQVENNRYLYSYLFVGTSYSRHVFDSTFEPPPVLSTPEFTINEKGEAVFEQKRVAAPPTGSPMFAEISSEYIYETVKSGDTVKVEQHAHVNFPDYMTYLGNGSMFMRCTNDWYADVYGPYSFSYGGIKQFNGVKECIYTVGPYWNIPLFTPQVLAHNRAQPNMKPFVPGAGRRYTGDDMLYAFYEFDNMNSDAGAVRVLSDAHPYTLLGQAGQCSADFEYQISKDAAVFPSFNLLQVSVNGKAVDLIRPDQAGTIRLVLFDPDSSVTSVKLSLLLAAGNEIELPVSTVGGREYSASIPSDIPTGFIDVVARVEDAKGDKCELTASPGFYFGSTADSVRLDARLRMISYALNNVEDINMQTGDTLNYTLTYTNYGNGIARNVVATFPTTPYFSPTGPPSRTIDSLGVNDTARIPVDLVFLGKQQSTDKRAYYSPSITWTSGGTTYLRNHKVLIDFQNTITGVSQTNGTVPARFELYQNYPNPFNPTTVVSYQLPVTSKVSLVVYDILGRKVASLVDGIKSAGSYRVTWDASDVSSGVYFCRLAAKAIPSGQAGSVFFVKKMMVLK
jgi:subtilisin family serine protease